MLLTTLALLSGQVVDAEGLAPQPLTTIALPAPTTTLVRGLLVTVVSVEDAAFHLAYADVSIYVPQLDVEGRPVAIDLLRPLDALAPSEQGPLRETLVRGPWLAWARAPRHVRALRGCPEPPLRLADAARQLGLPLATLAHATLRDTHVQIRAPRLRSHMPIARKVLRPLGPLARSRRKRRRAGAGRGSSGCGAPRALARGDVLLRLVVEVAEVHQHPCGVGVRGAEELLV